MSVCKMPTSPASASKGFSSTPLKYSSERDLNIPRSVRVLCGPDVLSEDELDDTFSLLSPIYHDSFDSDEDLESAAQHPHQPHTSPTLKVPGPSISPVRCELPKTHCKTTVEPAASLPLNAWEVWLLNKAKEDRLKLKKKAEEECLLQEKKEQQERMQEQKKIAVEEKIQEWLRTKREQEKQDKELKQSQEEVQKERQKAKQREVERRAQDKYKEWLRKKNQDKLEKEKKEKEEAARKEEQEKERRRTAEERFEEWLASANAKTRASPKSSFHPKSPYNKAYPPLSFYNPIPWKPIHAPPLPETPVKDACQRKHHRQSTKYRQSPSITLDLGHLADTFRLRNTASAPQLQQRR